MRIPVALLLGIATSLASTATFAADDVLARADERYAVETDEVPSFRKHVVPLMGKLGCNGRACHGSFQGQGGFRLSLFGYDFKMDHDGLTAGDEPRVDPEFAENSLALLKPTLEMPHRGGKRMDEGGWEYDLLVRWIESGAKNVADDHPEFAGLEVTPKEILFGEAGQTEQLKVIAVWSDGSREDVTPLSRFKSNGTAQATIDEAGLVTAVDPGDTHVVVFYDNGVVPIPVIQPVSESVGPKYPDVPTPTKVDELVVRKLRKLGIVPSDLASDAEFLRRVSLDMTGTLPAPAEIEAFLADGSPDKRSRKIDELLESPAYSAWWATKICDWTGNNENFLNNVTPVRGQASQGWYEWVEKRVANNTAYDDIVKGILVANGRDEGESYEDYCKEMSEIAVGDASLADRETMPYYWSRRNLRQPEEKVIGFAYTFMGIRIQCAQCHKHPFDQWTQDDFDNFKGFFTTTLYGNNPAARDEMQQMLKDLGVAELRGGDQRRKLYSLAREGKVVPFQELYSRPVRSSNATSAQRQLDQALRQMADARKRIADLRKEGKDTQANQLKVQLDRQQRRIAGLRQRVKEATAKAKLLGGDVVDLSKHADVRDPLMAWLRDQPLFAKAFVNRVWAGYFNVGIVEPTDDLSLANPPSNEALLDHLAEGFVANGFDMKWLHREIANSRTYQLSWVPNETNKGDERNFSHAIPRRLPAEVAVDAITAATASDEAIAKLHEDMRGRAIAVASPQRNNQNYSLAIFGRNTRESNCDCDRSMEASLLQTVYLRNDQDVYRMIDRRGDGWVFSVARRIGAKFKGAGPRMDPRQRERMVARIKQQERNIANLRKQGKDDEADRIEGRLNAFKKQFGNKPAAKPAGNKVETMNVDDIVTQAYLRTLSRPPRADELEKAKRYVTESDDTANGIRDLLWALLNTKEFIVNH